MSWPGHWPPAMRPRCEPARLSLEHPRLRPAHHQHRRRQHLGEAHETDPLTGEKGRSALGQRAPAAICAPAKRENFSSLYQDKLIGLQKSFTRAQADKGPKTPAEDDMVAATITRTFNLNPRASSIDTPLHSFIPGKHVDHMHPNAAIAIAAARRIRRS
jgi:hypothetical protein